MGCRAVCGAKGCQVAQRVGDEVPVPVDEHTRHQHRPGELLEVLRGELIVDHTGELRDGVSHPTSTERRDNPDNDPTTRPATASPSSSLTR